MKYIMLIYGAEDAWTDETQADCMAESTKLCHELASQGQFLGASPLHPVATATCVRIATAIVSRPMVLSPKQPSNSAATFWWKLPISTKR